MEGEKPEEAQEIWVDVKSSGSFEHPSDKMLDIDEGPKNEEKPAGPSNAYLQKKENEKEEEMKRAEDGMKEKQLQKKMMDNEKLYMAIKALTAMKLTKEDSIPALIYPDIFLGSIGAAYNKKAL
jgi:hypothetical protein